MESLFAGVLLLTSLTALAQTSVHSNLNTSINDDDKTYSIRIDGDRGGKTVHYNRTFNVAGMSKVEKETLKNRVLDSLGLGEAPPQPVQPRAVRSSNQVTVTFTCTTCTGKTKLTVSGNGFSAEHEVDIDGDKSGFPFELAMPPGNYRYVYQQNNVIQMQQHFTVKAGEENRVQVK